MSSVSANVVGEGGKSPRVDQAQAKVEAADRQSRDELQANVEHAQGSAERKADEIKAQAAR